MQKSDQNQESEHKQTLIKFNNLYDEFSNLWINFAINKFLFGKRLLKENQQINQHHKNFTMQNIMYADVLRNAPV